MSIRLDTVQTLGRNLKEWGRLSVPLICVARYLSDRPIDWLFFWIGWKFLRSSTTYLFVDSNDHMIRSKNEVNNHRHRVRSKPFTATRTASTTGVSHLLLTALPSVVLSNVACYLHPRDVLDLDTVLRSGMGLQNSGDGSGSNGITRRQYDDSVGNDIWNRLWYRDYGDVLLRWKISREAFRRSLIRLSPQSTESLDDKSSNSHANGWLEEQLSKRLDEMTGMEIPIAMKDFYFLFGECYIDFVLARKNTIDECFLGLHGHIFDFTDFAEYHPGLIEPILKECGGDATHYFEDLPHSSSARNIAQRLCVLVDHSVIDCNYDDDDYSDTQCCGLELVPGDDSSELKHLLRSSNTRPPPPTHSGKSNGAKQNRNRWMAHIVPRYSSKQRRHPTLERIRTRFQQEQRRHERQQFFFRNNSSNDDRGSQSGSNSSLVTMTTELISSCSPFWKQQEPMSRLYYDPLGQEWVRWCPDNHETCLA